MKPYIVYLNKSFNVWMMDAYKWAQDKGWEKGVHYENILSEVTFWRYVEMGMVEGRPVYFVKDIITDHPTL